MKPWVNAGFAVLMLIPLTTFATSAAKHLDPTGVVIFWVTLIFLLGAIGQYIARRLNQPGVLGELLMGVFVGNLCYFLDMNLAVILREGSAIFNIVRDMLAGVPLEQAVNASIPVPHDALPVIAALQASDGNDLIRVAYVVDIFSRYGVIFLLFMVGLESSIEELKHTGRESFRVAVIGVVVPLVLGIGVMYCLLPSVSFKSDLFVAAALTATSVGISARVLKEMKKLRTREARTILGAAMIDDILGLIILAVVSSIVVSGAVNLSQVTYLIVLAILFFAVTLWLGPIVLRYAIRFFSFLELWEAKLFVTFIFVMGLAWLASSVELATIIGAFSAGVIIHDGFFAGVADEKKGMMIQDLVRPFEAILAPMFFMLIGIQVKLETFLNWQVLLLAAGLIFAAILGKLLSGLGGSRRDDRLLIGIGMLPRGEVGLVFASIGSALGVITDQIFSSIVLMVVVTTFVAPIWLKRRYVKKRVMHANQS